MLHKVSMRCYILWEAVNGTDTKEQFAHLGRINLDLRQLQLLRRETEKIAFSLKAQHKWTLSALNSVSPQVCKRLLRGSEDIIPAWWLKLAECCWWRLLTISGLVWSSSSLNITVRSATSGCFTTLALSSVLWFEAHVDIWCPDISRRLESEWMLTNSRGYRLLLCGGYSRYMTREPVPGASSTLDMSVVTSPVLFPPWCRPKKKKKKRGQVLRCRWQPVVSVHVRRIKWSEYFHPRSASNARCIQRACFHRVHKEAQWLFGLNRFFAAASCPIAANNKNDRGHQ